MFKDCCIYLPLGQGFGFMQNSINYFAILIEGKAVFSSQATNLYITPIVEEATALNGAFGEMLLDYLACKMLFVIS